MPPPLQTQPTYPSDLASHSAYKRVFRPGSLTFGFIMPLEGYPDSPFPTLQDHQALAQFADDAGFSALWMRDVPFYDPQFGDTGQMLDPMVYLGFLASQTTRITLGTTGMVLPLRDPIILAKQAASVDQLSGGRLLLGLSSGDRAVEYPAFGADYDNRAERYREAFGLIKTVCETSFPVAETAYYGKLSGNLDLIPKPFKSRIPMIVVGRARQDLSWIAEESDGWIWHLSDFSTLPELLEFWRGGYDDNRFRPYGYATFFDLDANPDAPLRRLMNGITVGRNALIKLWKEQERQGVNHVALNLKPLTRPAAEVMAEMAEFVLPEFPSE